MYASYSNMEYFSIKLRISQGYPRVLTYSCSQFNKAGEEDEV